jgi:hypothetical protein
MILSQAERFRVACSAQGVRVDLRLKSATGSPVEVGTFAVFMN